MSSRTVSLPLPRPCFRLILPLLPLLVTTLLVAPLAAQPTPEVGLYWDQDYSQNETTTETFPFIQDIYLVLKGAPTGVLGWELCPDIEGEGLLVGWSLEGQAINASRDPGCFTVGLAEPLPATGNGILLATGQVFVEDLRAVTFQLKPTFRPAIVGSMAYLPADDPENPRPMITPTGSADVAWLNPDAPWLEVEPRSLRFESSPIGYDDFASFTVTNTGGGVLNLDLSLSEDCVGFTLTDGGGPLVLAGGSSRIIEVKFHPTEETTYECQVDLGPSASYPVYLFGTGREAIISYSLPNMVDFEDVVIGYSRTRTVTIYNTGEVPIHVDPELAIAMPELEIYQNDVAYAIQPGRSRTIGLRFSPLSAMALIDTLKLGDMLPDVPIVGTGRDPMTAWTITPENMVFTPTAMGYTREASVRIRNTGDNMIAGEAAFTGDHTGFEIFEGGGNFSLYAGQSHYVWIRFTPTEVSTYRATLDLGGNFLPVPVQGEGQLLNPGCSVIPAYLDFGGVPLMDAGYKVITIENPGNAPIYVDPRIDSSHYSITPNPRTLQPGEKVYYTVVYRPLASGTHNALVETGSEDCSGVQVTGRGYSIYSSCDVRPDTMYFGPVNLGRSASQYLYVENSGTRTLNLSPAFLGSNEFELNGGLMGIPPGFETYFLITYTPQEAGTTTIELTLGDACQPVVCIGTAVTGFGPYENLVGIYFDRDYIQTEAITEIPNQEVTGYLVLHNPSETSGVGAWELEVDITGEGSILGWELEGDDINVGEGNELIVGLGTPLMPNDSGAILLGSFQLMIYDPFPSEVTLQLRPIYHAAIPGLMAWIPGHDPEMLIPLLPNTGIETVSWINNNALPATEIPAPMALVSGSVVSLQWPVPEGFREGFHVYRRATEAAPTRLTQVPVSDVGGLMRYTDQPDGFAPGSTLYYSYALIEGGVETVRSPETEVTVGGVPALATRLLPNVPNPFNPMTRVRFELEMAEQIKVAIFDLSGRHIRTLVDGNLGAGPHERVWDGKDDHGRQAPSGAYYVRLVTRNRVDHHKMMLLK